MSHITVDFSVMTTTSNIQWLVRFHNLGFKLYWELLYVFKSASNLNIVWWTWGVFSKGQIKPKVGLARCRFFQKMNKRIWFVCCEKKKTKQNKFIHSFFGRIYGVQTCFRFYLTFSLKNWIFWPRTPERS